MPALARAKIGIAALMFAESVEEDHLDTTDLTDDAFGLQIADLDLMDARDVS